MGSIALSLARPTSPEHTVSVDFDALFLARYQSVFRLAYRITGTREEAEDLAQEAFLRLHRSPNVWRDQADRRSSSVDRHSSPVGQRSSPGDDRRVAAWLYRVVTNLAYNSVRGYGRRQRRENTVISVTGEADPVDLAERAETRLAVRQALKALPERQVQLLLLRYAGLSYKELAEALNVAPGSVGTLLARAEAAFEKAYSRSIPVDNQSNPVNRGGEGA